MTYTVRIENKYFYHDVTVDAESPQQAIEAAKAGQRPPMHGKLRYSIVHPS